MEMLEQAGVDLPHMAIPPRYWLFRTLFKLTMILALFANLKVIATWFKAWLAAAFEFIHRLKVPLKDSQAALMLTETKTDFAKLLCITVCAAVFSISAVILLPVLVFSVLLLPQPYCWLSSCHSHQMDGLGYWCFFWTVGSDTQHTVQGGSIADLLDENSSLLPSLNLLNFISSTLGKCVYYFALGWTFPLRTLRDYFSVEDWDTPQISRLLADVKHDTQSSKAKTLKSAQKQHKQKQQHPLSRTAARAAAKAPAKPGKIPSRVDPNLPSNLQPRAADPAAPAKHNASLISKADDKPSIKAATGVAVNKAAEALDIGKHPLSRTACTAAAVSAATVNGDTTGSSGYNRENAEQQNKCVVCWTSHRETTLAPCGHRLLCR